MPFLFSKPKSPSISLPTPPAAPDIPSPQDLEAKAAEDTRKENLSFLQKRKRSATLLTGAQGVEETGVRKTILG